MTKDKEIIKKQDELISTLAQSLSIIHKEVRANDFDISDESDKRLKMYGDHIDQITSELAQLKAEADGMCSECKGNGWLPSPTVPDDSFVCPHCNGSGELKAEKEVSRLSPEETVNDVFIKHDLHSETYKEAAIEAIYQYTSEPKQAQGKEVGDKDIEEWAEQGFSNYYKNHHFRDYDFLVSGRIEGAKAMRDGKIKAHRDNLIKKG